MSLETPISRSATFVRSLTPVPCKWTAQIVSVNRGLRFRVARVLCIRNPRYAELRLSGVLCHVSLMFGRLRFYREIADRDLLLHNFLTIENSDEQNVDGTRSFATCPHRQTAMIALGFSYEFPDSSQMMDTCPSLYSSGPTLLTSPSGYHRSRFPATQFPYLQKPRFPDPQLYGIL
jgi:hypothetical protein